jgi:hypothetical protein
VVDRVVVVAVAREVAAPLPRSDTADAEGRARAATGVAGQHQRRVLQQARAAVVDLEHALSWSSPSSDRSRPSRSARRSAT